MLKEIISGGQTGADRAALDFAIHFDIPHSGWCPAGRRAEDGTLSLHYRLRETPSRNYGQRTRWNVRDSDGTAVFTIDSNAKGGSLLTLEFAKKIGKPCIHITPASRHPSEDLCKFVTNNRIGRLNVAGSRESAIPGIYGWVMQILEGTLAA